MDRGGVAGLDDRSHARTGPREVGSPLGSMPTMLAVKRLQENPELGAFRIHAALRQIGIEISPTGALRAGAAGSWR